jgi:four helix bundle protein
VISIQERTFDFGCRIVLLVDHLQKKRCSSVICNQLLKSGTSIGANTHEADSAESKKDFVSKCSVALKEARETQYWLRLVATTKRTSPKRLEELLDEAGQIVAILTTIVKKAAPRP